MRRAAVRRSSGSAVLRRAELRRKRDFYRKVSRLAIVFAIMMTLLSGMLSIRSFAKEDPSAAPRQKYYTSITVARGESLSSIADRYRGTDYASAAVYIAEVVELNHLPEANHIEAGDHLIVPYYSDSPAVDL